MTLMYTVEINRKRIDLHPRWGHVRQYYFATEQEANDFAICWGVGCLIFCPAGTLIHDFSKLPF